MAQLERLKLEYQVVAQCSVKAQVIFVLGSHLRHQCAQDAEDRRLLGALLFGEVLGHLRHCAFELAIG